MSDVEEPFSGDSSPHRQPAVSSATAKRVKKRLSRSRLGCMTCRTRKVKCDEVHPHCEQCTRLVLTCIYQPTSVPGSSKARKHIPSSSPPMTLPLERTLPPTPSSYVLVDDTAPGSFTGRTPPPSFINENQWSLAIPQESLGNEIQQLVPIEQPLPTFPGPEVANNSWLLEDTSISIDEDFLHPDIFGEQSFWSRLPIFSHVSTGQNASMNHSLLAANTVSMKISNDERSPSPLLDRGLGPSDPDNGPGEGNARYENLNQAYLGVLQSTPDAFPSLSDTPSYEVSLLRYFLDFAIPPILIGVEPSWNSARSALLKVAESNSLVRRAICAFSALSLAEKNDSGEAKSHKHTSAYFYDLGLTELRAEIDNLAGHSNDARRHDNILASIFFLSYVELMMSSAPRDTLELLSRACAISRGTQSSKTMLGEQLKIWLKILDARVVGAGGDGTHLVSNPCLKDLEGLSENQESMVESVTSGKTPVASETPQDNLEQILFNCINNPAYKFYVQLLDFTGRIARLDRWHRPRGSVADELDVMQAAQRILSDLDDLWSRRPAILNLATDQHGQLTQQLSVRLAKNVQTHLRTYEANFYACFVHAQRALFPHLPTTPQTLDAVERIVTLVRLCERDCLKLSVSMLWPLLMAACETSNTATREWLIKTVEGMNGGLGNIARTAELIREICRRQEGGHRADARSVMQDVFGTIFAII